VFLCVGQRFINDCQPRNRSAGETKRILKREVLSALSGKSIHSITKLEPALEKARDRVLSDDELVAVIQAARMMGFPYGSMVEFLILTAQRRGEVAELVWDEINLGYVFGVGGLRSFNSFVVAAPAGRAALLS
jgi:integrase